MRANKGFATILVLVAVLFVATVGGAYYLGKQSNKSEVTSEKSTQMSSPSSTSVADETANWKTYLNSEFSFSFKYPNKATLEENLLSHQKIQVILNKDNRETLVVGATKDYHQANVDYFLDVESSGVETINGNTWKVYSLPGGYGDGPSSDTTPILGFQIEKNDILYSVTTYGFTSLSEDYRKILQTFKFTP